MAPTRRIALLSDIHANLPALDAVLADIEAAAIGERYCLGDLIGYGPDPGGVIERLRNARIPTIPGNYDEGVATRRGECGCYYATDEARADGAESYKFTDRMLTEDDAAWLRSLPAQIRLEEGDARVLLTHGSPRKINEYLLPDRSDGQLARLALEASADVVCHGHVHVPYHRALEVAALGDAGVPEGEPGAVVPRRIHYVSTGSVGKPKDGDPRAAWIELVLGGEDEVLAAAPGDPAAGPVGAGSVWLGVVVHRVTYDVAAVADAMRAAGLPERLIEALATG